MELSVKGAKTVPEMNIEGMKIRMG